ncbi:hypothetical protein FGKAn22_10150 [Ferrigenium kumadai]|uniref:DUF4124 domain-containing protein n=1 Tax=Ferrigenium kumadai TaxID=1682490 RepID=A0AAN1SYX4_9PROT|nr:DUF4124 domain-containing protein [Ferrigenium kumadai]BBI99322.1 hypothetical protein FGKAn22_10150 [Ferrigenium kumadai]
MKRYLTILLLLSSTTAFAALSKWVDEKGEVHYSDAPPPANVKAKTLRPSATTPESTTAPANTTPASGATAASAPAGPKTIAEREAELKKAQQAKKEAADRAAKEQANKETEKANCAEAQQSLRTLQEGRRITEIDAQGEYSYLEDDQRQQRIAKAQESVKNWCK